jgi:fructose-1,6-bisphosphatase
MIDWLRKNKKSLSIRGIERQLKMPNSTLIKAVNGTQKLAKHWEEPLKQFLNNLKNCKSVGKKIK